MNKGALEYRDMDLLVTLLGKENESEATREFPVAVDCLNMLAGALTVEDEDAKGEDIRQNIHATS